jgi:hypothetical protein
MPVNKQVQHSLTWARKSRAQWKTAYDQAVRDEHSEDADLAVKQIAMFDRVIEGFERLLVGP